MKQMPWVKMFWVMAVTALFIGNIFGQSCSSPVIFTSQSTTDTSVHFYWLIFDDPQVGFELTVVPEGKAPDSGSIIQIMPGVRSYTVDDLEPNTTYRGFIRSLCFSDTSRWVNHPFLTDLRNQYDCLTDRPIPDNGCGSNVLNVSIHVPPSDSGQLGENVRLSSVNIIINHPYPADLRISLVNPRGEKAELVAFHGTLSDHFGQPGDSSCTMQTRFSQGACTSIYNASPPFMGTFQPEMTLEKLEDGGSPHGEWILQICDRAADDIGFLEHASLDFDYSGCPIPPVPQPLRHADNQLEMLQRSTGADSCILGYHIGSGAPQNPTDSNFQWIVLSPDDSIHTLESLDVESQYEYYTYLYCNGEWIGPSCPGKFDTFCGSLTSYENWSSSAACEADCDQTCPISADIWRIPAGSAPWSVNRGPGTLSFTGPTSTLFPASEGRYLLSEGQILACDHSFHQLRSVCLTAGPGACGFGFYYHMRGVQIGTLQLLLSEDEWTTSDTLFIKSGTQGQDWQYAYIPGRFFPDGPFQLEFQVLNPGGPFSEIALGDMFFSGIQPIPLVDQLSYYDEDGDGYGDANRAIFFCGDALPDTLSMRGTDCNDQDSTIYPGQIDRLCSGMDENCDGIQNVGTADPLGAEVIASLPPSCPTETDGRIELSIQGGVPPYEILWNTGTQDPILDSLSAGQYSVTITDSAACQSEILNLSLDPVYDLEFSFSIDSRPSCLDPNGGSVNLFISGGTPPYEYAWSNGRTTPNNDSLEAGPFSITVTDANGCIFPSEEQTLSAIDIFEASINLIKPISCPEGANGELKASVQGATTPITYTWNTGDTTPTLGQVSSGWYQVTVSDSTDCQTVSDSFFVTAPQPIELSSLETRPQRCIGVFDAEVNIEVRGGSSPYAYAWLTPDGETLSQRNLKDIGPGNYQLTITDFNGCSQAFEPIEVDSASGFTFLEALTSASSCPISPDGHIDIALSEGLAPLSIQWSDGAIGALSRDDLRPGFYELTITNPLECKRRLGPFEIPAGQEGLEVELTAMDTLVCDSGKGIHIESEVSEGQTPVEYHWNSGRKIIRDQLTDSLLVLTPGRYTVTVTDSYGCVGESEQIEILGKAPIELDQVDVRIPDCPDYKNGYIEVSASTTAPPLRYSWSNGDQLAHIRDLSAGIYELTIEDDTRCLPFTASYELSGPSPFEVQIDTFYQNDQVCFEYQISGGLPPYNRFWNDIFNQDNPICFDPDQSQILFQIEDIQSCGPNLVVWESSTSSDVPLSASFDVEIYPNPVKAILHIESSSHSPTSLEVFHISGHKWDEVTLNSPYFTYQMERFPPGVYIFRFANDNGQVEFREVVKQ